jgi:glycine/D-amino acid oxidase-like deaminating enzyme
MPHGSLGNMRSKTSTTDFLVIGGGIIGVSVARELQRRHPAAAVTVLEKELAVDRHASGRNSGVLHAGFYYSADSLKARFTRDGNATLRDYYREKSLPLNQCGKLVVARTAADHPQMDELLRRRAANGATLRLRPPATALVAGRDRTRRSASERDRGDPGGDVPDRSRFPTIWAASIWCRSSMSSSMSSTPSAFSAPSRA